MTDRDLERRLHDFYRAEVAGARTPDRLQAALASIPERTSHGVVRERSTVLVLLAAALLIASLAIIAAGVGSGRLRLSLVTQPTPPLQPTPSPSTATARAVTSLPTGSNTLATGTTYGFALGTTDVGVEFTPAGDGWGWFPFQPVQDHLILSGNDGLVGFAVPDDTYLDPCHRRAGTAGVGPGVDDLIAGLAESLGKLPGVAVDAPRASTIGGVVARELTVRLTSDFHSSGCDLGAILLWHEPGDLSGIPETATYDFGDPRLVSMSSLFGSNSSASVDLFVLDIHGTRVLVEVAGQVSSGPAAELMSSIRFTDASREPPIDLPVPVLEPSPDATSAFSAPTPLPGGFLVPGTPYSVWLDSQHQVGLELTVPEPLRWRAAAEPGDLTLAGEPFADSLKIAIPSGVYRDACNAGLGVTTNAGTTAHDLARSLRQALKGIPNATVSELVDVTIGDRSGRAFVVSAASFWFDGCVSRSVHAWPVPPGANLPLGSIFSTEFDVVDVNGTLVVVVHRLSDEQATALDKILQSLRWK